MTWNKIFDGVVDGDHITVERYVDAENVGEQSIRVKATDKNPPTPMYPIIEPGSVQFPPPPIDPLKRYTCDYDSIEDMLSKFAEETGRTNTFTDALKKAMQID